MKKIRDLLFRLKLCFSFYKKLLVISAGLTILLLFLRNPLDATLIIKICLLGFLFLNYHFLEAKDKLLFYKNFSITPVFLFSICIFYDFLLSLVLYKSAMLL
ncbi:hypothetical protein G3I01_00740 [Gramella sp. MT6]|uniref:hypothetical protein n=1 Tax=Gramella sp. MT6 TaxID=2705471 RepID=UPI001C5E9596|nr:hypothetical protein [Gramella sp. MT6]QYA24093.1 hypothetical protein G3I01_00740 [Gramella sp. MT6]